jgi:hypothetical protein
MTAKQEGQTNPPTRQYHAYLLRMWAEPGAAGAAYWRFSLENVQTGSRRGFADLAALCAFLQVAGDEAEPGYRKRDSG